MFQRRVADEYGCLGVLVALDFLVIAKKLVAHLRMNLRCCRWVRRSRWQQLEGQRLVRIDGYVLKLGPLRRRGCHDGMSGRSIEI